MGINAINCPTNLLSLEPYFSNLSVDLDYNDYVMRAQEVSKFNIPNKFVKELNNDIIIEYDGSQTSLSDLYSLIVNFEEVVEDAEPNMNYEVNGMMLKVKEKKPIQIKLKHD